MKNHRRGFSLIEMVVTIGLVTTLLASLGIVFKAVFQVDQRLRATHTEILSTQRLLRRFRRDVRAAQLAEIAVSAESLLHLQLPNGQDIIYTRFQGDLLREVRKAGQHVHREVYWLPRDGTAELTAHPSDGRRLLRLQLTSPSSEASILAAVGRDVVTLTTAAASPTAADAAADDDAGVKP